MYFNQNFIVCFNLQSSEYVKLQQKVNQLSTLNEDLKDEQKHLEARVRELESDLSNRPTNDFMQVWKLHLFISTTYILN